MIRALFVVDDVVGLNPDLDSTLDLVTAASARGWDVWLTEPRFFCIRGEDTKVSAAPVGVAQTQSRHECWIPEFDVVFLRIDPPIDSRFTFAAQALAEYADRVLIVNRPSTVLGFAEKLLPFHVHAPTAPTIVTSDVNEVRTFADDVEAPVVLKPLYDYRGAGVYVSDPGDKNLGSVFTSLLRLYPGAPVLAQAFIPEIDEGDRRVFMVFGEPVAAINRRAAPHDFRANLARGGRAEPYELATDEESAMRQLGRSLMERGVYLAGVDLIGAVVTEINMTAPTGHVQARELTGVNVSARVCIETETFLRRAVVADG